MLPRRHLFFLLAASATAAVAGAAVVALGRDDPPEPAGPIEHDVSATGYIEEIQTIAGGCVARIAVYEWQSLSPGFPLAERPQRDDRFHVLGSEDDRHALLVARAISEGHLAFRVGASASQWYFMEPPQPGVGCAGFMDDWAPGPMGRVF